MLYVRLLHHLQELAGIGGEGVDVAALTLGIDGVEGEGGLAGAGQAGDDDQAVAGEVDVDALEIMLACAADAYGGQHSVDLCREICVRLMGACCSRFVLGRQGPGRRKIGTVRRKEKAAALLPRRAGLKGGDERDFGSDAVRSEEHTSELQSLMRIAYAVF